MCREYADAYSVTYEEPVGFLEFLRERNRRTQWRKTAAPDLKYAVLEDDAEIDGPHGSYTEEEWQDIAEDTRKNTRLVLQTEYGASGDTAILPQPEFKSRLLLWNHAPVCHSDWLHISLCIYC